METSPSSDPIEVHLDRQIASLQARVRSHERRNIHLQARELLVQVRPDEGEFEALMRGLLWADPSLV